MCSIKVFCFVSVLNQDICASLTDETAPFMQILVGGDMTLLPMYYGASVKSAIIGGHAVVAGSSHEDITGAVLWYSPGKESFGTYVVYSRSQRLSL